MKDKRIIASVFATIAVLIFTIGLIFQNSYIRPNYLDDNDIIALKHDKSGTQIQLAVAASSQKRADGLMFVESLNENEGMFFIFDSLEVLNFWMKNTPLSLDIIFLDQDFRVVNIHKSTIPNQTRIIYSSVYPAKYVIELESGWSERHSLSPSDSFSAP